MGFYESLIDDARIVKVEKLEKLHTRQLLAIIQRLRVTLSLIKSDETGETDEIGSDNIKLLNDYKKLIKTVLSTREHIPNKTEARKIRQEKAKRKK